MKKQFTPESVTAISGGMPEHLDDICVLLFASLMRKKLKYKREQGYEGWETVPASTLANMLLEHISKGDVVDIANFCMFLSHHEDSKESILEELEFWNDKK